MFEHKYTESSEINFSKLENRIMQINNPKLNKANDMRKMLYKLTVDSKPTIIIATGGSKIVAYYLQLIIEKLTDSICEVIEPRDYFYKANIKMYSNLVAISASGKSNGIKESLADFQGNKYLICENVPDANYQAVFWSNELYDKEKSFISLASSLCPMSLMLAATNSLNLDISPNELKKINSKIRKLISKSTRKIDELDINFKKVSLVQIMSGYDTKVSSSVLESNLVEAGLCAPIIHDKGSYCHGRSNLLFRYPDSHLIYLVHQEKELDRLLISSIREEYSTISVFDTEDLNENMFWKEYYLSLQMYFLSKKIASNKNIDLTQPGYNPQIIDRLYNFKGEM